MDKIEIQKGDITKVEVDAIVNPANSHGWMGAGAAGAIKNAGGEEIEKEAVEKAPLELGSAVKTTAGKLPHQAVIHAPTMENPTEKALGYNIGVSVKGALFLADDQGFKTIAFPGMGTGVGGFPPDEAAKLMIKEIKDFQARNLEKVILIDLNDEMVKSWTDNLK